MPLKQQFCPKLSLVEIAPETLELQVSQADEPIYPRQCSTVIITGSVGLAGLQCSLLPTLHRLAFVSDASQVLQDFHGRREVATDALLGQPEVDLPRALATAAELLQAEGVRHRRILLLADVPADYALTVRHAVEQVSHQDIAVDVVTTAQGLPFWQAVTTQSFGRALLTERSTLTTVQGILDEWESVVVTGCEVRLQGQGLSGIGPEWLSGRTTLPTLCRGEQQTVRIQVADEPLNCWPQGVQVRFLGLGYATTLRLPPIMSTRQLG